VVNSVCKENGSWDLASQQPKNQEILERCLKPLRGPGTLSLRAAKSFCAILRYKPFRSQNRRLATAIILAFLARNNSWIRMTPAELLWLVRLPEGRPPQWEAAVDAVEGFMKRRLTSLRR